MGKNIKKGWETLFNAYALGVCEKGVYIGI